jgi:hypothetical protein
MFFISIFRTRRAKSRMQHVFRFTTVLAFAALAWPLRAEPSADTTEYKQADTSFYLKSDVLRADPDAVILTPDAVTDIGGSYLVPAHRHARFVYLQQMRDWIEPITPPSMPASLNIPSNAMQVREPQGDVQVALPSAPANFHSIDEGMTLPNGSVLKTGDNGSVAVLFGGVDSVRLAPDSQAAVQMAVAPGRRDAEVDIHSGIVFSKVGQRIGEKESYEVHTPFGTASAHGTDFVTVVLSQRVDVWVAGGTVELVSAADQRQTASVADSGAFKVMRSPAAPDEATSLAESAESLTTILNFIPMANQKLKVLSERTRSGAKLTSTEQAYIGRIRKIPALIKLSAIGAANVPEAPVVPLAPLTPPGPAQRLPSTFQPTVTPPAAPTPKPKPITLETPAVKNAPTKAAVAKSAAIAAPRHKKQIVIKTPESEGTKPAVAKADEREKTKTVVSTVTEKTKPKPSAAMAETTKPKPSPEKTYPRAKPVSASEMVSSEPPKTAAPAKPRVPESDPNSLGAPLNPYATPIASNSTTGANAAPVNADGTPAKKTKPAASGPNDTVP